MQDIQEIKRKSLSEKKNCAFLNELQLWRQAGRRAHMHKITEYENFK